LAELAQALAVVDSLADQRRAEAAGVRVADRPGRSDDRDSLVAGDVARVEILVVDDVLGRHSATRAMAARDGDVDLRWADIAETAQLEGGLIRQHSLDAHWP
jgi:hypothetical protein